MAQVELNQTHGQWDGPFGLDMVEQIASSLIFVVFVSFIVGPIVGEKPPAKAGIVFGVLLAMLLVVILVYFVWRYRRDGSYPSDIFRDMKRKARSRFGGGNHHVTLHYDTDTVCILEDES